MPDKRALRMGWDKMEGKKYLSCNKCLINDPPMF